MDLARPAARPRGLAVDVALASAVAVAQLVMSTHLTGIVDRPLDWLGWSLLVAIAAPLAVRRVWPVPTLVAVAVLGVAYNAFDYPAGVWTISVVIAVYTAGASGTRIPSIAVVALAFAGLMATDAFIKSGHFTEPSSSLWFIGWVTVGFVAGEVSRARRAYLEEAERRVTEAERTREEEARRRASEERMRIARELHDVLAHSISQINVQAGVALHLLDRQPEGARPALVAITQASRDALQELRATLDVMRGSDDEDPRAPAPSLARVEELVSGSKAAGIDVRLQVTGEARPLPPAVDLAAYRIVQESLTNVARHARPARATVSVDYGQRALTVEIADEGQKVPGTDEIRPGHGLIGMRERAASVGGQLEVGPLPSGGFRVRASLPIGGHA